MILPQEEELISRQEPKILFRILESKGCPLTSRERYVLERRYLDEPRPTLGQVAETLNLTKERVRQIENKSLEKMKNYIEVNYSLGREDFIAEDRSLPYARGMFSYMSSAN